MTSKIGEQERDWGLFARSEGISAALFPLLFYF
jgi:hypothetical protein